MTRPADSEILIAYAAEPGRVAYDGDGENSLYASALANALRTPGRLIDGVFRDTRKVVRIETKGLQKPEYTSSLENDYSFAGQVRNSVTDTPVDPPIVQAGFEFQDCDVCPQMVVIPSGEFRMGSPNIAYDVPVFHALDKVSARQIKLISQLSRPFKLISCCRFAVTSSELH